MTFAKSIVRSGLAVAVIAGVASFAGSADAAPPPSSRSALSSIQVPPVVPLWNNPAYRQQQPAYVSPYAWLGGGYQPVVRRPAVGVISSNVQQRQSFTTTSITGANKFLSGPTSNWSYYHCVPNVGIVGPDGICH